MIDDIFVIDAVVHAYNQVPENFADQDGRRARWSSWRTRWPPSTPDPQYDAAARRLPVRLAGATTCATPALPREQHRRRRLPPARDLGRSRTATSLAGEGRRGAREVPEPVHRRVRVRRPARRPQGARARSSSQVELLKPLGLKLYPTSWYGRQARLVADGRSEAHLPAVREGGRARAQPRRRAQGRADRADPRRRRVRPERPRERRHRLPEHELRDRPRRLRLPGGDRLAARPLPEHLHQRGDPQHHRRAPAARVRRTSCSASATSAASAVLDRMFWGSGGTLVHPRPGLEAFMEFEFPQDQLDSGRAVHPRPSRSRRRTSATCCTRTSLTRSCTASTSTPCKQAIAGDEFRAAGGAAGRRPRARWTRSRQYGGSSSVRGLRRVARR